MVYVLLVHLGLTDDPAFSQSLANSDLSKTLKLVLQKPWRSMEAKAKTDLALPVWLISRVVGGKTQLSNSHPLLTHSFTPSPDQPQ
jgi:hypothetical protein